MLGARPDQPPVAGLEHEFTVTDGARQVDFASVIHGLSLGRRQLDPDDPNAYRLETGAVVTSDKREAEIALAPFDVVPGFGSAAARRAEREATALRQRLPVGLALLGYSTHISIEVPEALTVEVAKLYVRRFGPAMLLAMDGPEAPGLRIRPRHRRLELCGDFVAGERLRAALEFAAGSVATCIGVLAGEPAAAPLPPPVVAAVRPAIERPGWFIDQPSLGLEPGQADGVLRLADGRGLAVRDHVEVASQAASDSLGRWLDPSAASPSHDGQAGPFGDLLQIRHRPGVDIAPVLVSWPLTVFMVSGVGARQPAFAAVPREWLGRFLSMFDGGDLDSSLRGYIRGRHNVSRAIGWHDVRQPALFDDLPSRLALMPPEPL